MLYNVTLSNYMLHICSYGISHKCAASTCELLVPACRLDGHKTSSSHLSWMFYLQGTIQGIQWGQLKKCMLHFCSHCSVSHACAASTCQLLIPACRLDGSGNEIYVTWICSYTLSLDVAQFLHGMITSFVIRWSERAPHHKQFRTLSAFTLLN